MANISYGSNLDIDNAAEQLVTSSTVFKYELWIKAAEANTGNIHVGFANTVTAGTNGATDGYQLDAGDEVVIPKYVTNDASNVWLIASAADQKVYWMAY